MIKMSKRIRRRAPKKPRQQLERMTIMAPRWLKAELQQRAFHHGTNLSVESLRILVPAVADPKKPAHQDVGAHCVSQLPSTQYNP